ncbi:hypothetical protein FVB9532_01673 [Mesonia oceanica]|uniref:Uncharacterized protein n=1 Tax=Mesonia oceanica TaxID=2687242 RepID=A0AC61Y8A1_9FLAO|nr:hypothetical protein FVB9532_01673 [Mesonia oceanica]|tara:strand:+ start:5350 stop:5496 length:147 start_codon:yes stop_codon:yes gene_type:complete
MKSGLPIAITEPVSGNDNDLFEEVVCTEINVDELFINAGGIHYIYLKF